MPHRRPTKAERERVIAVDLLADWHPYAVPLPEPRSQYDWRYFGTIAMQGETGALAWRAGSYGFGVGHSCVNLASGTGSRSIRSCLPSRLAMPADRGFRPPRCS